MYEIKCGIYKITSPSNKIYIGQAVDIDRRKNEHQKLSKKGLVKLYNSLKKYGFDNHIFEIVELCAENSLNDRERYWQDFYDVTNSGLNCRLTTTNDKSGKLSEETKRKISEAHKGKIISEETKKRMSEAQKNRPPIKEETREKLREARKHQVIKHSKETIQKRLDTIRNNGGFKHSEEAKKKISIGIKESKTQEIRQQVSKRHKGKITSEETKKKISEAIKAKNILKKKYGK